MHLRYRPLAAAMALAFSSTAFAQSTPEQARTLDNVQVNASRIKAVEPASSKIDSKNIATQKVATSDTTALLSNVPGVAISSAGGVSGLPVLHGMADDRNRIKIDGMDLISACANHMNSPLSYIAPSNVDSIQVYAGISPVSLGGDSIGGTILVKSKAPRFAAPGAGLLTSSELGSFYRSNGNAWGVNASATLATENLSITYNGSTAESENYKSGKDFKSGAPATYTKPGDHWIAGNEVGSSAYKAENHALGIAYKFDNHLLDLKLGYQHIPYQGFPNQHMDMTRNESTQINLGYTGKYNWGRLEARVYHEETNHEMNFAEDKLYWYGSNTNPVMIPGMPMNTEGRNTGALVKAEIQLSQRDLLRVGGEYQRYRLNDWWPASYGYDALGNKTGGMQPDPFINIKDGQRDRYDLFGEWEASWNADWQTLFGVRSSTVKMNSSGDVAGYNTTMANYLAESTAFYNSNRVRTDNNFDLTALARYSANDQLNFEGGYARKTRSPSIYERYTWSTGPMAMAMNNWVNDGNGYIGNRDLKPEVAHTLSFTLDWHDASRSRWGVKLTPYYSHVDNYIDAKRCGPTTTGCIKPASNLNSGQFVYLTLANNDARLYGIDLSGFAELGKIDGVGSFMARGLLGYVKGENRSTGDNLYNIMPLNAKLALEHRLGNWNNTVETVLVSGKHDVSAVRNEMETSGYGLLNLRSSYEWKNVRLDLGLENVFDQQYSLPLGGAYIGQGRTMSLNGIGAQWGTQVPGMGRSLYAGINIKF